MQPGFQRTILPVLALLTAVSSFYPSAARADLFSVPPLHLQRFDSLGLPPLTTKELIQKSVQSVAEQTYGQAFVDIGDMSDLMHGHILWDPKIHDPKLDRPLAILFHTQEFPNIRPDGYIFKGRALDPFNRNWISWQQPIRNYKQNDLTPAQLLMPNADGSIPTTVSSDMLDSAVFGPDVTGRSTTFFFYRFSCNELLQRKISATTIQASNIIQIRIESQPVCLALVNEVCNTSKETSDDCPGKFEFKPIDHRDR